MNVFKALIPLDDLKRTALRFPYSTLCSLFLFILTILSVHDVIDLEEKFLGRLLVLGSYGFFWFGLARLISEGKQWPKMREQIFSFGVFAILAGFVFFGEGFTLVWLLGLMVPALLLGISVGPYIAKDDNLSLWFYNRQTWQGVSIAILAGIIWAAGICGALLSIHYLFEVDFDSEIYADIWAFSCIVFGPLYALSWVPERFSYTEDDCHAPPQLSFVLNWVFAPLVVVYMLILYAYFIKIAVAWELPRGHLSYMITAFGGIGVFTYLAGWPLRNDGGPFLKVFYKLFFPALILPVVMQALSIYLRIEQYGITEQRYIVVLATLWMGGLAVAYTLKKPSLKCIPGALAVMLVIAAIGPLSAPNIAENSQMSRLEKLLIKNKILVDGQIVKTKEVVSFDDRGDISSIIDFLNTRRKLDVLKPWLAEVDEQKAFKNRYQSPQYVAELMGIEHISKYERTRRHIEENINLRAPYKKKLLNVDGYKLFLDQQRVFIGSDKKWKLKDQDGVQARYENDVLYIGVPGQGEVSFDIQKYALEEHTRDPSGNRRDMILEGSKGRLKVKLIMTNISLQRERTEDDVPYELKNFNFKALIGY